MQASEFLLPLNGASDSAPPWIVGAKNCIDMFLPPEARQKQLFYECLTCGQKMKKWSDMIGHIRKNPKCASVAEVMRLRRLEVVSLGAQLDRQGILRSSSTRCGHHGCSQPAILCGFCCGAEHIFCEDHAYCPLCHFWHPYTAVWVDEDCCAYGKCQPGQTCGYCDGRWEAKDEKTQQAEQRREQMFGRPVTVIAEENGAEVPCVPKLPGAFGKQPERVVKKWMVMPYPELCPWQRESNATQDKKAK